MTTASNKPCSTIDTDSCLKDLNTPALHLLLTHLIAPAGQNNNKSIGLSTELKDKLVKVLQTGIVFCCLIS